MQKAVSEFVEQEEEEGRGRDEDDDSETGKTFGCHWYEGRGSITGTGRDVTDHVFLNVTPCNFTDVTEEPARSFLRKTRTGHISFHTKCNYMRFEVTLSSGMSQHVIC